MDLKITNKKKSFKFTGGLSLVFVILFGVSCCPTKKLLPHQYLVNKVEIDKPRETKIPVENFEAFYRQKPNRKLFGVVHFFVWWYNLFDKDKIARQKIARNQKYDELNAKKALKFEKKNEKLKNKGKKSKVPHFKNKEEPMLIENIRDIGEPPVILDSSLIEQTRYQLSKYLYIKGYFNNEVKDTIILHKKSQKATIQYILKPKQVFTIKKLTYQVDDIKLLPLILNDTINSLLKKGSNYDKEILQNERQRITDLALNSGYYFFENAYTDFTIDSFQTSHQVNIKIRIKKYAKQNYFNSDSILYQSHPIYKISNVYIITEAVIGKVKEVIFSDTLKTKENKQVFLFNKALAFKESLMLDNIDLYAGQLYRKDTALHTYKQLLSLGVFKNVIINFLPNDEIDNTIDCYIVCNPLIKQSITSEIEGTNTSGNLGIDGSLLLQNKNLFKGAELIELKLQGSLSAQAQFNNQESSSSNLKNFNQIFNTIQIGPEITFAVPRAFFPFSLLPFNKDKSPRTYIKSSANYQSRPQFNRFITSIDYGFSFRSNANKIKHDIIPFEVYMVRANLSSTFQKDLKAYNDAFLLNSFENHITTLTKYSLTYLSKENTNNNNRPANFIRFTAQSSGNILRQLFELSGESKDAQNRYLILGIPFAQFIKTEIDYRRYVPVRKKSRVVMRIAGGIAKPFTNLTVVPYEQSFFSGGPNSIRAWRARTLGPGSYNPTDSTRFDKIGDILLETNFEYRFHIINSFNGALFVDAGNIWRLNANEDKPKSEFLLNKFADQIAIGAGMGLRWDLNFFVLRLDLAVPIKDPKFAVGNRWTFDKKPFEYLVANFGIGYPF